MTLKPLAVAQFILIRKYLQTTFHPDTCEFVYILSQTYRSLKPRMDTAARCHGIFTHHLGHSYTNVVLARRPWSFYNSENSTCVPFPWNKFHCMNWLTHLKVKNILNFIFQGHTWGDAPYWPRHQTFVQCHIYFKQIFSQT